MSATFAAIESRVNAAVLAQLANATMTFPDPIGDVAGVFDAAYVSPLDALGSAAPMFQCAAAAVANVVYGTTGTIGGVTYKVVKPMPDGRGMTQLKLERQA